MRLRPPTARRLCLAVLTVVLLAFLMRGSADATAGPAAVQPVSHAERILQGGFVISAEVFGAAGDGVITLLDPPELSPITPVLPQP